MDLPTSLSVEKLANLVDDMAAGPDDKHMPASVRIACRCEKDTTGDLNRDSLINCINEIALNTLDAEEEILRPADSAMRTVRQGPPLSPVHSTNRQNAKIRLENEFTLLKQETAGVKEDLEKTEEKMVAAVSKLDKAGTAADDSERAKKVFQSKAAEDETRITLLEKDLKEAREKAEAADTTHDEVAKKLATCESDLGGAPPRPSWSWPAPPNSRSPSPTSRLAWTSPTRSSPR